MDLELREAGGADTPILHRLMQLYLYDLGTIDGWDIGDDGLYGTAETIETFWTDPKRRSFLIRVGAKLAGFALVRDGAHFAGEGWHEISEFFVLRRYRRQGVGAEAARRMFDRFPGKWEVTELTRNVVAQAFWRQVIGRYTGHRFEELPRPDGRGVMQRFDNSRR
jgi:predicted acetyltransferase